jgi:hypothetical protein
MGMILRIASSRIVGQGDIVGRSGYFSLNLSANSVMRGRLDARRTLKSLVADLRLITKEVNKVQTNVLLDIKNLILLLQKNKGYVCKHIPCAILKC